MDAIKDQAALWDHAPENTPQIILDLMEARHKVQRLRSFGMEDARVKEACWEVQQILDHIELWVDVLREEYPSVARDE